MTSTEPDICVRIMYADLPFAFLVCPTAATNFLRAWRNSHHPALSVTIGAVPQPHPPKRLPCERLWLTP
ncbi:hypothetical protein CRH09_29840 [Nocardia terpenica]|uniref:Uncharacterized protein n=1 Tax=Nocardia terpenica TaxID=455432 RepID=A0A291RR25_9NOCA|nr:hypothetical protein CRH09_29840 [Nocardia terpenica]